MIYPSNLIDEADYSKKLMELLSDKDCILFIDTNIIAQFYKLHSIGREEFFKWADPLITSNNFKTPSWAINEYSNRVIGGKLNDYLPPIKKTMENIERQVQDVYGFLLMLLDDEMVKNSDFNSRDQFLKGYKTTQEAFSKLKKAVGKEVNIEDIHKELELKLTRSIIKSNIFDLITRASIEGKIRYENKMPPGFMDISKGDSVVSNDSDTGKNRVVMEKPQNQYGDLVLWLEILAYSKEHSIKKAILITNDSKKDWVYSPQKKINISNGKVISNTKPALKIADPRLVYEFEGITNSNDFYIIDFTFLIKLLHEKYPKKFEQVANCVQIISMEESDQKEDSEELSEVANDAGISNEKESYSPAALADKDFILPHNLLLSKIIEDLKSYNWDIQNDAMKKLSLLKNTKWYGKDLIFILGRNIYQAACGGSFSAMNYIKEIRKGSKIFHENKLGDALLSGMIYEAYFDSRGEFRKKSMKIFFLQHLFDAIQLEMFQKSLNFIMNRLEDFTKYLLVTPKENKPLAVLVKVKIEVNGSQFDEYIEDLTVEGRSLLRPGYIYDESKAIEYHEEELIILIGQVYGVPMELLTIRLFDGDSYPIHLSFEASALNNELYRF